MKSTSFRIRFFITFLAIFLLPVFLLGFLGIRWATQRIYENTVTSYNSALENLGMRLNADIDNLDDVVNLISKNSLIKKITYMQGDVVDYSRINIIDMQEYKNELLFHCTSSPLYDDITVCFPNKNLVISTLGIWHMDWFLQDEFRVLNVDSDEFTRYLLQNSTIPNLAVSKFGNLKKGIAFVRVGITNSSGTQTLMSILFWIDKDTLQDYFKTLALYNGTQVMLFSNDGNLVFAYVPPDSDQLPAEILKNPTANTRIKDAQGVYYQAFRWQETSDSMWQYAAFVPEHEIFGQVNQVKLFLLMLLVVISLVGCGLSWELATLNYRPFERLFHALGSYAKTSITPSSKNMPQIEQALLSILKDHERLRMNANDNLELLQSAALSHLLEGDAPYQEFTNQNSLNVLGINLPYNSFLVCAVLGYADEDALTDAGKSFCQERPCTVYSLHFIDDLYFILNYDEPRTMKAFISAIAPMAKALCVSEEQPGLRDLAKAYHQVKDVIRFYPLDSEQQIFYYTALNFKACSLFYPAEVENNLMLAVRDANESETVSLLTSLWEKNNNHYTHNRLLAALEFTLLKTDYTMVQLSARFRRLPSPSVNDEAGMWQYALSLIRTSLTYHREIKSKKRNDQAEKLLAYVDENICNDQLSLASTAAACGLSIPYLSRIFKENFNIGYLDYVNRKRTLLAKDMLSSQKCTVREAAIRVGFNNDAALRRAFKKYEGTMPSQTSTSSDAKISD